MKHFFNVALFFAGIEPFNRATLFNAGFREALIINNFDCFIFHDVDLIPDDERNIYKCPSHPRHMSVFMSNWKYKYALTINAEGLVSEYQILMLKLDCLTITFLVASWLLEENIMNKLMAAAIDFGDGEEKMMTCTIELEVRNYYFPDIRKKLRVTQC